MNERKPSLAERLASGEGAVSIINELVVDFGVDHEVKLESATARARKRWRMTEEGEADER